METSIDSLSALSVADGLERPTSNSTPVVSIVMPCLNEVETLGICIEKAAQALKSAGISGEIIVADNGSSDGSREVALRLGARLAYAQETGYGHAVRAGIQAARGKYVVMGDADDSYDFHSLTSFVRRLEDGFDLVMGNRFTGGIRPGAMPALHRYFGNPLLTGIGRWFFQSPCGDFNCGLRAFRKGAIDRLNLRASGMELASEMVVKATLGGLRITEIPTTLSPDGRSRSSHLRSWRDGWRHLRFMLIASPKWLFLYPGIALLLVGGALSGLLLDGPKTFGSFTFDVQGLFCTASFVLIGSQAIGFAFCSKAFGVSRGLLPQERWFARLLRFFTLERGLVVGSFVGAVGAVLCALALQHASTESLAAWRADSTMRIAILGCLLFCLGCQVVLTSFLVALLTWDSPATAAAREPRRASNPADYPHPRFSQPA